MAKDSGIGRSYNYTGFWTKQEKWVWTITPLLLGEVIYPKLDKNDYLTTEH